MMFNDDNHPNWPHWLNWLLAALALLTLIIKRLEPLKDCLVKLWRWLARRFNAMSDLVRSVQELTNELKEARHETNARFLAMEGTVNLVRNRAILAHAQADMMLDDADTAIFRCELPSGQCTYVNKALSQLFAMEREQMKAWGWTDRVHPDDVPRVLDEFLRAVREGKPYRSIYRRWLDNQALTVEASGHIVNDDHGTGIALIGKVIPLLIHR